jgi:hypothetical protein
MTDRDLFYCTDFACDGHARSNERCLSIEEATCAHPHCDYDPEVDGQHRHPDMPEVSGNAIITGTSARMWRLDAEGNPIGEAVEFPAFTQLSMPLGSADDALLVEGEDGFKQLTLDLTLTEVDPALMALLTGTESMPYEVWAPIYLTWWQRAWNRITRRNKGWRLVP